MAGNTSRPKSVAALVAAFIALSCAPAWGHTAAVQSQPRQGEVLSAKPDRVQVKFNEEIAGEFHTLRVYNDRGLRVDRGVAGVSGRTMSVTLVDAIRPGTYVVHWRVAGSDGHPVSDSFVFDYLKPTRAGLIVEDDDPYSAPRAVARWAMLVTLALTLGSSLFAKRHRVRWTAASASVAICVLALFELISLTGLGVRETLDHSILVNAVQTRTGAARAIQLVAAILVLVWPRSATASSVIALAVEALAGHAAAAPLPMLSTAIAALHVVAMGVWLGGLVVVVFRREAIARYSSAITWVVAVLILTGAYNAWAQLGSWSRLFTTTYGRVVGVKVLLLLGVLAFAWFSRTRGPRKTWLLTEVAGITLVVAMAAALGGITPARSADGAVAHVFEMGGWRTSFAVDPARAGANEVHLIFLRSSGQLAENVESVKITARRTDGSAGPFDLRLRQEGEGHYVSSTAAFNSAGRWAAMIRVQRGDGRAYERRIELEIAP